jgi:hypothetical protein
MSQDDMIRQAFANLESSDTSAQIDAIRTLGRLKVKDAVSLLVRLLPDAAVGRDVARALIEIGSAALQDSTDLFQQPDFSAAKGASVEADEIVQILRITVERNWAYVRTDAGAEGWVWAALLRTPPRKVGAAPRQEFGSVLTEEAEKAVQEAKKESKEEVQAEESGATETRRDIPADLLDDLDEEAPPSPVETREIPELRLPPEPPPPPQPAPGVAIPRPEPEPMTPPAETSPTADRTVQLSAYYPKEAAPDLWLALRAYIYRTFAAPQVLEDAKQQLGEAIRDYRRAEETARADIQEGALVTATPELPGFQINPPSLSLLFVEDWHRFDFKLRATTAPLEQAANGRITFTVEGVIVADLPLSIFVSSTATTPPPTGGNNPALPASVANTTTKPYQSIFCSYSHKDTQIVERVERAYKALGLDFLRDVIKLKSGQDWNAELLNMIDRADIFQLFWSTSAAQSKYVRQEWEHALQRSAGRTAFIRPVYWEEPMPPVPPELGRIHFAFEPTLDD